ncbi:hypothetical protein ABIA39_004447 [Nocardia sp. GAS34]|uniref:hypothetical protein n=1 Tax=unclassified Nocardia TaxID=2637762 RepID=UPI003D1D5307
MTTLDIHPQVYYDAARQLNSLADQVGQASSALGADLQTTAGMGGADPAAAWNNAYRQHANDTIDSIIAYSSALRHFSDVLNVCGWNWDTAEYNANIGKNKGTAPSKPTLNAATGPDLSHVPDPNAANGVGLIIDPLMLVPAVMLGTALGKLWIPSGNRDQLEAAADAWKVFAGSDPIDASPALLRISDSFGTVTAPEVMDIQEILITLENGKTAIWNAAKGLAGSVQTYRDKLVGFRAALTAEAPHAFPRRTVTTGTTATAVTITLTGGANDDIDGAATALENVFTQHPLSEFLRTPIFDGAETPNITGRVKAIGEIPRPTESGNAQDNTKIDNALSNIATWDTAPTTLTAVDLSKIDPALRPWAESAVKYGNRAGVDPRLVLAIVANEGATRTLEAGAGFNDEIDIARYLTDPARAAGGYLGIPGGNTDGNSLGLTNMKESTFNEVKAAFPDQFKNDDWHDLIGNNDLAIKATTYKLKLIENKFDGQVPGDMKAEYTLNQFLAASYNAGDDATSGYIDRHTIGPVATTYMNRAIQHFNQSQDLMCDSGAYTCN